MSHHAAHKTAATPGSAAASGAAAGGSEPPPTFSPEQQKTIGCVIGGWLLARAALGKSYGSCVTIATLCFVWCV